MRHHSPTKKPFYKELWHEHYGSPLTSAFPDQCRLCFFQGRHSWVLVTHGDPSLESFFAFWLDTPHHSTDKIAVSTWNKVLLILCTRMKIKFSKNFTICSIFVVLLKPFSGWSKSIRVKIAFSLSLQSFKNESGLLTHTHWWSCISTTKWS